MNHKLEGKLLGVSIKTFRFGEEGVVLKDLEFSKPGYTREVKTWPLGKLFLPLLLDATRWRCLQSAGPGTAQNLPAKLVN